MKQSIRSKKQPSIRQLESREKLAMGSRFLSPLRPLLNEVFNSSKKRASGYNTAISHLLNNNISGEYPSLSLNYAHIKLSRGKLPPVRNVQVYAAEKKFKITWLGNQTDFFSNSDDEVVALIYNESKNGFLLIRHEATRRREELTVRIPDGFKHDHLHGFLFLRSRSGISSGTLYLGKFIPAEGQLTDSDTI